MRKQILWWLMMMSLLGASVSPALARPLMVANPALTIAAAPWPLVVNQGARITITASNPSGENADNVTITAGVPNNMGLQGASATQGGVNVYNSAVTNFVGTLAPGQTVYLYLDVIVVTAYPTDAPFNLCSGLTFTNGTARLSCLPNQPAGTRPGRVPIALPPNGQRPIYDPNRPPVYLPVTGAAQPMGLLGPIAFLGGLALLGYGITRRRHTGR